MVGLPTNTNMYIPMSDNPSIRKVSIINFSNDDYELGLNGPAFVMLDMSDLGLSYDIKSTGNGVTSKSLKEKDITMKIAINYVPDSSGNPVSGATTYDALTFFLSKLRSKPGNIDRRGCNISTLPDLCLKWDVPTNRSNVMLGQRAVVSRYRDIVVTDMQWTEVDKQYQAIILDLTIKPIGPWYYRIIGSTTVKSTNSSSFTRVSPSFTHFNQSAAKLDMDLYVPFRYGIKMKPTTISSGNQFGSIELQIDNTLETQAFYAYFSTSDNGIYMGNLRGVPYIINSDKLTSQNILPGSPLALSPCTNGYLNYIAFNLKSSVNITAEYDVELNVPIAI